MPRLALSRESVPHAQWTTDCDEEDANSSESEFVPSIISSSEHDELDDMDDSDESMSLGSSDTYSTMSDSDSDSMSSFLASTDDSDEFVPRQSVRFSENKRLHADVAASSSSEDGSITDPEDDHPRKFRRLYLPPRSIHEKASEPSSSTSSPSECLLFTNIDHF